MFYDLASTISTANWQAKSFDGYKFDLIRYFGIESPVSDEEFARIKEDELAQRTYSAVEALYKHRTQHIAQAAYPVIKNIFEGNNQFQNIAIAFSDGRKTLNVVVNLEKAYTTQGAEIVDALERGITLAIIDQEWKEHLRNMDDLRSNVQFAAHEQKDPLLIYKFESYELFKSMIAHLNGEISNFLLTCQLPEGPSQAAVRQAPAPRQAETPRVQTSKAESMNLNQSLASAQQRPAGGGQQVATAPAPRPEPVKAELKIGRNDPCPCGSGKKYKNCHGVGQV
jgi:preprotein translocase subunit SecA